MTSRAEYRLILRQDNADQRLTPIGRRVGLVSDERWARFTKKKENIDKAIEALKGTILNPNVETLKLLADHDLCEIKTSIC